MDSSAPRYHERQSKQMCLKHTLNNLFQEPAVTSATLDGLADHLATPSWGFSPHRTAFLGNYDINVLELALQERGKMLQWVSPPKADEARSEWPEAALLERPDLFALVLNVVPSPAQSSGAAAWGLASLARRLGLAGRHWLGFRRFGGQWYNLDSHLPAPQLVGNDAALRDVLQHSYHCGDCGGGPAGGGCANACERPQLLAVLDAAPGR